MKLIAVQDKRGGIGLKGGLLMSLPTDMKYFRTTTTGHTVIMGRDSGIISRRQASAEAQKYSDLDYDL